MNPGSIVLRSVMSSPAAAVAALEKRRAGLPIAEEEVDFSPFVFDFPADDQTDDVEAAETTFANDLRMSESRYAAERNNSHSLLILRF